MNQRGFSQILIIAGVMGVLVLTGGVMYVNSKQSGSVSPSPSTQPTVSPSAVVSSRPSMVPEASVKSSPKVSAKPTLKPSASPAASSTTQPAPQASQQVTQPIPSPVKYSKVTCYVQFNPQGGSAPVDVNLIYAASYRDSGGGNYVTNVQWDWDGDGNWDTDFSQNNQHISHVYDKSGTYTARLRVQTKEGDISEVCSGSITIN